VTTARLLELALAVLIIGAAVFFYRRRDKSDSYGSQGAVILLIVGAIVAIHALGLLEYRPSATELEQLRSGG
jgi:hypothetical protein